jgi:UDP-N-acetylglucosamine 2-epimerase (non-hydrolysing)
MFEVLNHYLPSIESSDVLERLGLEEGKFFVVSSHREENINSEKTFKGLMDSLNLIAENTIIPSS